MRRRAFLAALLATAAKTFGGVIGPARAARPLIVGGTVSLSGDFAAFGEPVRRALTLWREQINASGGVAGVQVELAVEDDRSDADQAQRLFTRLATASDLLIAPYGSWLTDAVLPVIEETGRPCVAPSAGDPELWSEDRAWLVQLLNPADTMLNSTFDAAKQAGLRSAAFLHRRDPFSSAVTEGAARYARALGFEVRAILPYEREAEARAAARALAALPAADVVAGMGFRPGGAGSGFVEDALLQLEALGTAGVEPRLLCLGIGAASPSFAEAAGREAEAVVGSTGWRPYLAAPGNRAFVAAYTERWGEAPDVHAAQGYAVGEILARAWTRAAEGRGHPALDRVREGLFALDTETVFGRFRVNRQGLQVAKTNALVQWRAGRIKVVWPERYADAGLELNG